MSGPQSAVIELDKLLEDTIQGLCRTLPISGVAMIFAKAEEADDCPLVSAGTLHGPLQAGDAQTIRRLLIATTRFQEQLVIMLSHHQARYSAYTATGVEQQEQLLRRLDAQVGDCGRLLEDRQKTLTHLNQRAEECAQLIEERQQTLTRLERQCEELRLDVKAALKHVCVAPLACCTPFEGKGSDVQGTDLQTGPAKTPGDDGY